MRLRGVPHHIHHYPTLDFPSKITFINPLKSLAVWGLGARSLPPLPTQLKSRYLHFISSEGILGHSIRLSLLIRFRRAGTHLSQSVPHGPPSEWQLILSASYHTIKTNPINWRLREGKTICWELHLFLLFVQSRSPLACNRSCWPAGKLIVLAISNRSGSTATVYKSTSCCGVFLSGVVFFLGIFCLENDKNINVFKWIFLFTCIAHLHACLLLFAYPLYFFAFLLFSDLIVCAIYYSMLP